MVKWGRVLVRKRGVGRIARMGYINGVSRDQGAMFPATLEEYVEENSEVRVIDAFVGHLGFEELGFVRGRAAETGRPGYDPRILLAIYIWGHLNRIRSSRRLERECGRNVELMWLSSLLKPDFKTLCRFRQDNGKAIGKVLVQFRLWCQKADLFGSEIVAIDGSKFKAVNSTQRNMTQNKLTKLIESEKRLVAGYMADLEEADNQEDAAEEGREKLSADELKEKIAGIGEYLKEHEATLCGMKESGERQISLTDPDARLMKTSKGMDVCYNIQTAVDAKHKLIATVEVTNEVNDQQLLSEMALAAKSDLGVEELTVVADAGYYGHEVIKACEDENVTVYVPIRESKDAKHRGVFPREQFEYDPERDLYVCPALQHLTPIGHGVRKARYTKTVRIYATSRCRGCHLRLKCTRSKTGRKIKRWIHGDVLDRLAARLREKPEMQRMRRSIVEHPFGTIKSAMGHDRLLLKGIKNVTTEINLTVLSYNIKRVISILGEQMMIDKLKMQPA
jgi:transposase